MAPASPFPARRRWASTGPATRNDTGACSATGPAGSPAYRRRRPSTWPSSGSPRPHSARYGSLDADAATIDSAAAASIRAASALAPARRPMPSAVAPGTPASSACPSRGPRLNSGRPRSRSAAAAGRVPPSGPSNRPIPHSGPNACASGTISPAHPTPVRGTAGTSPASRVSASRWHSAADTPASPDRNVRSRTAISARASASSSHGGPPVALASSRLRWCSRCCASVSRTPDSAPMPVFTPYTGMPAPSTARAWRQR